MKPLTKEDSLIIWGKIKDEHGYATTEELFGLNDPVEHQCKFIDEVIKKVKLMQRDIKYSNHDDVGDLLHTLNSISYDISNLDDEINEIRTAIEEVREWGNQWKDLCKRIILKYNLDVSEIG